VTEQERHDITSARSNNRNLILQFLTIPVIIITLATISSCSFAIQFTVMSHHVIVGDLEGSFAK